MTLCNIRHGTSPRTCAAAIPSFYAPQFRPLTFPSPMHPTPPPWPICFGLETELGITVMEDPEADVVEESIALVRSAAQHGVANLWDYATEDPHRDARGFRVAGADAGHRRGQLLFAGRRARTHLPGNQERPRPAQRRALLQRSRPSRILHARMRHAGRPHRAGQGGRAAAGGMRAAGHAPRLAHGEALQEQHRFPRPLLRLPRQLPHPARHPVGAPRARHDAVPRHAPALRRRGQGRLGMREQRRRAAASRFRSAPISSPSWSASTR